MYESLMCRCKTQGRIGCNANLNDGPQAKFKLYVVLHTIFTMWKRSFDEQISLSFVKSVQIKLTEKDS
jgi:hypothetical protein